MSAVDVERAVPATPDEVWAAWTTEGGLATWWWAHWADVTYRVDATVGGGYRIEAAAAGIGVRGDYLELDPPHRLVLTWVWLERDAAGGWSQGPVERVEVSIDATPDGARVAVHHEGDWSDSGQAEDYRVGWVAVLDALAGRSGQRSA